MTYIYIYLCFDSHILWCFWVREVGGIGEGFNFKDPSGFQKFLWHLWPGECPWNTLEKFGWFFTKLWNQDPHSLVAWCMNTSSPPGLQPFTTMHKLIATWWCNVFLFMTGWIACMKWVALACFATVFVKSIAEWNAWFLDPWNGYTYRIGDMLVQN